jgi:hypothetical protein
MSRLLYPRGKSPWNPLDRGLGRPQSWSGGHGEVKILAPTGTCTLFISTGTCLPCPCLAMNHSKVQASCHNLSIWKWMYVWMCVCVCMCMFWHNYLSVNGIVSFPSFTGLYKYKEEYKQGEMQHSAQRAEISEEIRMLQPGHCQATGTWLLSMKTNNEELLIARQRFRNHGYTDGNSWSWKL